MSSKVLVCLLSLSIAWIPWAPALAGQSRAFAIPGSERTSAGRELAPLPILEAPRELDLVAVRDGAFEIADLYDPSTFFIEDLLERLDFEPAAAFEFVRDEIRFDPYDGILRGVEGVLGGRGGNALERSMLLKQLLEEMGFDARLVHGTLTDAVAARLLEQALTPRQADLDMVPLASLAGFIPGMMARLMSRAERDYAWVMAAAEADIRNARPVLIGLAGVRQHVWVQANMDGNWTDLDSAFLDASVGQRFAEPERFSKEPPARDHQVVTLSVIAETWHGKQLSSRPVLQRELKAAVASTSRIYLTFIPRAAGTGSALAKAMRASTQFVPVLTIDGDASPGEALPGISAPGAESGSFLASSSVQELTGLTLEVKTQSPDGRTSTSRRVLLDRVPARTRLAGGISTGDIAGVSHTDDTPDVFNAIHQVIVSTGSLNPHQVANNVGLAAHFAGTHLSADAGIESMDLDAAMWPMAMFRMLSVVVNEWLAIEAVNDLKTVRFLIAEPRIYLFSYEFIQSGDNSGIALSIDLLRDDVQAFGAANAKLDEVARRRTWYGVLQAAFETSLLEIPYMAGADMADEMRGASLSSHGAAMRFTAADDKRLPANVPAALLEQLGQGHVVVTSEAGLLAGAMTWWAIGPDGLARAMLAPSLGGVGYHWWQSHTNWRPGPYTAKITHTNLTPDMSRQRLQQEYQRAVRDAMKQAYEKGGGKAANNRVARAGKLPSTGRGPGGTEYTIVLSASALATLTSAAYWGMTMLATVTVAFIVARAFLLVHRAIKDEES
jgi:hypothetical protein